MKYFVSIFILFFSIINISKSQGNGSLEGEYINKPVPYRFVREADVMWSNTIWRMIDLRQKINLPLYYPTIKIENRMSLIDLLLWGIQKEGLVVYNPDEEQEFGTPMSWQEIENKFGVSTDTIMVEDPATGAIIPTIVKKEMATSEVKKILLKELWFFDKQRSQLEVRIIGICPIREYVRENSNEAVAEDEAEVVMKKLFWVDFSSVRFLLASHNVFNPHNDSQPLSFDDIFFKRRFSGYVYQESNVYDNRSIPEYKKGLEALLESNKIQDNIFVFEHDLWEY